jgi:hypothetical protein
MRSSALVRCSTNDLLLYFAAVRGRVDLQQRRLRACDLGGLWAGRITARTAPTGRGYAGVDTLEQVRLKTANSDGVPRMRTTGCRGSGSPGP